MYVNRLTRFTINHPAASGRGMAYAHGLMPERELQGFPHRLPLVSDVPFDGLPVSFL